VHAYPESRKYQGRFLFLKQEFESIIGILEDQQRVLVALEDSVNESASSSVVIEASNKAQGRENGVIEFSLQSTEETLANFIEMEKRRGVLEAWVILLFPSPENIC
jgi:hypothetical protein